MANGLNLAECYVRAAYLVLLNREPDSAGLQFYKAAIERGDSIDTILDLIASSEEFRLAHPGAADSLFSGPSKGRLRNS